MTIFIKSEIRQAASDNGSVRRLKKSIFKDVLAPLALFSGQGRQSFFQSTKPGATKMANHKRKENYQPVNADRHNLAEGLFLRVCWSSPAQLQKLSLCKSSLDPPAFFSVVSRWLVVKRKHSVCDDRHEVLLSLTDG